MVHCHEFPDIPVLQTHNVSQLKKNLQFIMYVVCHFLACFITMFNMYNALVGFKNLLS